MKILGISSFYHDSAAALVIDGEIAAAAQEERFTRKKHDPAFPTEAVDYCLREAGITKGDLDFVAVFHSAADGRLLLRSSQGRRSCHNQASRARSFFSHSSDVRTMVSRSS